MAWRVQRTESFDKWCKKEGIHDGNYAYHQKALEEFRNIPLPHNVQSRIFQNSSFECWIARLPDKIRKQGKKGGFRVVFIIDLEESIILLQGIFRRNNLSYEGSSGKYDAACDELIKSLASRFIEIRK
jgi:mRNA-degrading endonuclease RelE of RelBE toxin-antitoxin system